MNIDGSIKAPEFRVSPIMNFPRDAARKSTSTARTSDRVERGTSVESQKKKKKKKETIYITRQLPEDKLGSRGDAIDQGRINGLNVIDLNKSVLNRFSISRIRILKLEHFKGKKEEILSGNSFINSIIRGRKVEGLEKKKGCVGRD